MEVREEWDAKTLQQEFDVIGFQAPFVIVTRKSDGIKGSLEFTHLPRIYFNWVPNRKQLSSEIRFQPLRRK